MNIDFVYNTDFKLDNENELRLWITTFCRSQKFSIDTLIFAFFSKQDIKSLNIKYLSHSYYTDVISFDDSYNDNLSGNIAISPDVVSENAKNYSVNFNEEIKRVMIHGVLHFMGYNDTNEEEIKSMRNKEDEALKMFHVKQ
tara:strand:+ start:176 stop:598 length:423 start_codon:yes stop_codon:yes gene_type:complete